MIHGSLELVQSVASGRTLNRIGWFIELFSAGLTVKNITNSSNVTANYTISHVQLITQFNFFKKK